MSSLIQTLTSRPGRARIYYARSNRPPIRQTGRVQRCSHCDERMLQSWLQSLLIVMKKKRVAVESPRKTGSKESRSQLKACQAMA